MRIPRLARQLAVAAAVALAACGDDDEDTRGFEYVDDGRLTVMTRNLYLGAELTPVLLATTTESFLAATTGVFAAVSTTNDFRKRAGALAAEIATTRPDLVGLQEATLWRTQTPGDAAVGGSSPATTVAFDFLATLLGELSARGVPYVVAHQLELFDLEAPVPISTTTTMDVRLTDRQVILAIQGLPTSTPRGATFDPSILLTVQPLGVPVPLPILRGWTAVNATVGGRQVAFYNTHLEAFGPDVLRQAQAAELLATLDADPLSTVAQVLVGDLNSTPGTAGHAVLATLGGFDDLWASAGTGSGFTCCFDADLTVSTATLTQRIDYVLSRGTLTPAAAAPPTLVGDELSDRTGTPPVWPSDHAGIVGAFTP